MNPQQEQLLPMWTVHWGNVSLDCKQFELCLERVDSLCGNSMSSVVGANTSMVVNGYCFVK